MRNITNIFAVIFLKSDRMQFVANIFGQNRYGNGIELKKSISVVLASPGKRVICSERIF